jgi:hypothetical protein
LHSSFDELVDFVRCVRPKQIVPTSDDEAGGLESCSALCRHALGCETQVQVIALQTIIRNHETASSILGKRSSSGLYDLSRSSSRKGVVSMGATADSPSPHRIASLLQAAHANDSVQQTTFALAIHHALPVSPSHLDCRCVSRKTNQQITFIF